MKLTVEINEWGSLYSKLQRIESELPIQGQHWAVRSMNMMSETYQKHLATQGRGGVGPPLSPITLHLYSILGEPDGSGIRNHIETKQISRGDRFMAIFGIPSGKPGMVAIVQDRGATIPVTSKMHGFLAAHGVHLHPATTHIVIPARHSWEHSLQSVKAEAKKEVRQLLPKIINRA